MGEAKRQRVEQPEPDQNEPDRCQLVARVPSGRRFVRTFRVTDGVQLVYDWIDVVCAEEEFAMHDYCLVSQVPSRPRQELADRSSSLKDAGLKHQTMLYVTQVA